MLIRLLPLVLGAFAIGTETFMISGVLPTLAADLQVSPGAAGGLVTTFALAYAVGSPLLAIASAGLERKRLLMIAMGAFALANLAAAFAPNFASLLAARVFLALSAGAFMPAAVAFATAMHEPARRGRAVALVYAGMTFATVIGVPAGTLLATSATWRATFLGVAALAVLALVGVAAVLPRLAGVAAISLRQRIAVASRPDVLQLLALTALALCGPFAANTYLGVLLQAALGVSGN
jgi:predicted MFS family arabinose efflux permease